MLWFVLACTEPRYILDDTARPHSTPDSEPDSAYVVEPLSCASELVAGTFFHCCLDDLGEAACAFDGPGELADRGQTQPPAGPFTQLAAGMHHACGLRTDGSMSCWGQEGPWSGEHPGPYRAIDAGTLSVCALNDEGMSCWGHQDWMAVSELGELPGNWASIEVGSRQACALDGGGQLSCLGGYDLGQAEAPEGSWATFELGSYFGCVLDDEGAITCFGDDVDGQISDAPTSSLSQLSLGTVSGCGLDAQGSLHCWGAQDWGLLEQQPSGSFEHFAAGGPQACALQEGLSHCWGGPQARSWEHQAEELSYARDIQPILDVYCSDCHTGTEPPNPRLDLSPAHAYDMLTGVTWSPGLVVAGSPEDSRLLERMAHPDYPMPPQQAADEALIEVVERWIEQGAAP